MKKALILFIILVCTGCAGNGQKIIDFQAAEVTRVELYDIPVPAAARRKTVTDANEIQTILDTLSAVRITGDGAEAEPVSGGLVQFVFYRSDGVFILSYNGVVVTTPEHSWAVDGKNGIRGLWGQLSAQEEDVPEYELPLYPKNQPPTLGLGYTVRGDRYRVDAALGTCSWFSESPDGTGMGIEADAPHPLALVGRMPEIWKRGDTDRIELYFSMPPQTYTVRRWSEQYADAVQEHAQDSEPVDVSGDVLMLSDGGYIYEVTATWSQGYGSYSFYIRNGDSSAEPPGPNVPDSPVAAVPLAELPRVYTMDTAIANGDYVNVHGKIANASALDRFLERAARGEDAFLRTVRVTIEGDPIITDYAYDGTFTVRCDTSCDKFGVAGVETAQYQNLVVLEYSGQTYYLLTDENDITAEAFADGFDGNVLAYKVMD